MALSNMHGWCSGSGASTSVNVSNATYTNATGLNGSIGVSSTSTPITNLLVLEGDRADILIQKKSLRDWMSQVEKRLVILSPNPELLDKYTALQEVYSQYKMLEALLYEETYTK